MLTSRRGVIGSLIAGGGALLAHPVHSLSRNSSLRAIPASALDGQWIVEQVARGLDGRIGSRVDYRRTGDGSKMGETVSGDLVRNQLDVHFYRWNLQNAETILSVAIPDAVDHLVHGIERYDIQWLTELNMPTGGATAWMAPAPLPPVRFILQYGIVTDTFEARFDILGG